MIYYFYIRTQNRALKYIIFLKKQVVDIHVLAIYKNLFTSNFNFKFNYSNALSLYKVRMPSLKLKSKH